MPACNINHLSIDIISTIISFLSDPRQVYKEIPLVSRLFLKSSRQTQEPLIVNVEILSDDSFSTPIQFPESLKLLSEFQVVKAAPQKRLVVKSPISLGWGRRDSGVTLASSSVDAGSSNSDDGDQNHHDQSHQFYKVGLERQLRLHSHAITENPQYLVSYIEQLLKKGLSRSFKVLFGTVEVQGNHSSNAPDLASFLGFLRPQNIALWCWDTRLIKEIAIKANPSCIRLPLMKGDGNINVQDFSSLSGMNFLRRLELFRPFPRQPWGIESPAFHILKTMPELRHLIIQSGRLIHRHEVFVDALLSLQALEVLNLTAWTLSPIHGAQILLRLHQLESIQFIHVSSPEFWLLLPSFYTADSLVFRGSGGGLVTSITALKNLKHLGIHLMSPDYADLACMTQGIVRSLPKLESLQVRISRPTNSGTHSSGLDFLHFFLLSNSYLYVYLSRV